MITVISVDSPSVAGGSSAEGSLGSPPGVYPLPLPPPTPGVSEGREIALTPETGPLPPLQALLAVATPREGRGQFSKASSHRKSSVQTSKCFKGRSGARAPFTRRVVGLR